MSRINTNVSSLVAQNRLQTSNKDLQTALTRLSTGLRINTGSDDPAGLIASEALRSEITSLNKSISNTRRASQIISTADSALGQVSNLLNDIRGLVVEAANSGALSPDEIAANQLQVDSSLEAINRIAQTTTFQGRKLLDGSLDFITASGGNTSRIQDLRINNASLGSTGKVDVAINVRDAATQAAMEIGGFIEEGTPTIEGTAAAGSLTLVSELEAAVEATTGAVSLANAGEFTFSTKAGGQYSGDVLNDFTVNVVTVGAGDGTLSNIAVDENAETVTITLEEGQTLEDIATLLAGNEDFVFASTETDAVDGTDTATATLEDGVAAVTESVTINVSANEIGEAFNGEIVFQQVNGTATPTATFADGALTVTVNDTGDISVDSIVAAINGLGDFTAEADGEMEEFDAADPLTATAVDLTGGTDDQLGAITATGGIDFEIETTPAVQATSGTITTATSAGDFTLTAAAGGAYDGAAINGYTIAVATVGAGTESSIAVDDETQTITITLEEGETLEDIAATLAANEDFVFASTSTAVVVAGDADADAGTIDDGEDAVMSTGSVNITAAEGGAEFNGDVVFVQTAGTETPTATYQDGTLTVTVDTTGTVSLAAVADAISALDEFSATTSGAVTEFTADDGTLTVTANDLAGGLDDLTVGVQADAVFELSGLRGSEVFNVSAGTTLDQLADQINLVTDATGIQASLDGTNLLLTSTDFGSAARVELRILSQNDGGNFGEGGRTLGTDIVATVNGRMANGVGNRMSVNTATLNMSADMESGYEGEATFTIVGGGANFQLGPEVVGNQQARIGIGSVNAARLGGVSGKLYELGSGESAALADDPTRAARIVTEAIAQVAGLRGRLGAFQATSLDSNLVSLSDTVANLQEAESTIRDADFAAESAALTRAQILVQSGTNVLSLANQNPQNVLALLR